MDVTLPCGACVRPVGVERGVHLQKAPTHPSKHEANMEQAWGKHGAIMGHTWSARGAVLGGG